MECVREKVWEETPLCIFDAFDVADQSEGRTIAYASHDRVQPDGLELIHKRLHADPVIPQEHHSFFPALMGNIYHLFRQLCNLFSLECLKIKKLFRRDAVSIIHIALVNNKFRTEFISHLIFKLLQYIRTYRGRVAIPVHIFFASEFVKDKRKLMKKRSIPQYVYMRIFFNKFPQTLHGVFMCFWLSYIKRNLLFKICPSVCYRIVHMYRIPHNIRKEAYRIIMKFFRAGYGHISTRRVITPLRYRHCFSCCSVDHFPPSCYIVPIIYF